MNAIPAGVSAAGYSRRHEVNSVGIYLDHLRPTGFEPLNHFLQQIASDLRYTRCSIEIGEVSLRESQITVEAVEKDFESVLQRLEMMLSRRISFRAHSCFGFEPEVAEIGEQMPKNLQFVCDGKAIELQHDRRIKRGDVAMPDVARYTGEENVGVTAFERARHRQLGNGMAFPKIFAQEQCVDPRGVAAHDHFLVIVRKNLGLDEIARAQQVR